MSLRDSIRFFTEEAGSMCGLSVSCGTLEKEAYAMGGDSGQGRCVDENTVYDLASLTKLFTALSVMMLAERGKLSLCAPVTDYAPMFRHLSGVTVGEVLCFQRGLRTPGRVDTQMTRDEALQCLFAIAPLTEKLARPYSDMNAMVLKYCIEGASDLPYMEWLRQQILSPLGMRDTFACVPEERLRDCIDCNREHRIEGDRWILRQDVFPGMPHDPKAFLLQGRSNDLCGHAGLFATRQDMVRLCRGILQRRLVNDESLRFMTCNRTGERNPDGTWRQFLGTQCYVKHPDQHFSEVPVYMSGHTIALSGFTGHHLSVDCERNQFCLVLGNRVHDRLTMLIPPKGKDRTMYGLQPDGTGSIVWEDGHSVRSSVEYVYLKDAHLHNETGTILRDWVSPPSEDEHSLPPAPRAR